MTRSARNHRKLLSLALAALAMAACSPKRLAEESIANALSESGDTFQSDDDPQLIEGALPFGLKTMESLLTDLPHHRGLLLAACSGFTSYGAAFVQEQADEAGDDAAGVASARAGHERARRLFLRAHGDCLRNLEVGHPGLVAALLSGDAKRRDAALAETDKDDVAALYWTAASWGLLIKDSLNDLELVGQLPVVAALAERALALDPGWNQGTLYDLFVSLDAARSPSQGGGPEKAKAALAKALEASAGTRLGPILSYAEGVELPAQDRQAFEASLKRILAYDLDLPAARTNRLANTLTQRRARWLEAHLDELFL